MIHWVKTTEEMPEPESPQVLFKVRGEKFARVGEFVEGNDDFPHSGFEDTNAAEFYRAKRVSHWAPINLP